MIQAGLQHQSCRNITMTMLRCLHRAWSLRGGHHLSPLPKLSATTKSKTLRGPIGAEGYHGAAQSDKMVGGEGHVINLRSDTFTLPTPAMKEAMVTAPLGDDVYMEDPTVNKLQEECASLLGKEAALLVPSGTMGNITALLTLCTGRFQEVLLGDLSHIHLYEVGGIAALAGVHPRAVKNNPDGTLDLDELEVKIRDQQDSHYPLTAAICLENTHNMCGGRVLSVDYIKQVRQVADAHGLMLHLDGARIMNAATGLQVPPSAIGQHFDSISMCFSKGLSCPVGSVLAGSEEFISRAVRSRKALGGGMRQAGVIAAPMLVALEEIVPRLKDDHARAKRIAQAVADVGEDSVLTVDVKDVQSNIVMLHTTRPHLTAHMVANRLMQVTEAECGDLGEEIQVSTVPFSETALRLVTYHGVTDEHVHKAVRKMQYVLREMASH